MDNKVEAATRLLSERGLLRQVAGEPSSFLRALDVIFPTGTAERDLSIKVAVAAEEALVAHSTNRTMLALLCALLQRLTDLKTAEVAAALAAAAPDLVRSLSWVSKLVRAGNLWLDFPVLSDIEDVDKVATLSRIPKKLHNEIFGSGKFPDGTAFRTLTRQELASAVADLRVGPRMVPHPHRIARKELLLLANDITPIIVQLAGLPEFSSLHEKLATWQREIIRAVETTPIPRFPRPMPVSGDLIA